jgi:hypothetical protein
MSEFTKAQLATVRAYLAQVRDRAKIESEEWAAADPSLLVRARPTARRKSCSQYLVWVRVASFSAEDIHTAIWWYRYRHKPGSKQWRPTYILRALIIASERDYAEPEQISVNERALNATLAARREARKVFIKKHGVAAFYQKVKPVLAKRRSGGVKALFQAPATSEIREYVAILSKVAV